jgi:hypothetical protein
MVHCTRLAEAIHGGDQMSLDLRLQIADFRLRKQDSIQGRPTQRQVD